MRRLHNFKTNKNEHSIKRTHEVKDDSPRSYAKKTSVAHPCRIALGHEPPSRGEGLSPHASNWISSRRGNMQTIEFTEHVLLCCLSM